MPFKGNPYIKGVRGSFSSPKQMSDKQVIRNLRRLGELGMRFDLNVAPASLAEAAQLASECPDTRFVLDHCGNADPVAFFPAGRTLPRPTQHSSEQWKRDIGKLAAQGNVICKISGIVSRVPGTPLAADDLAPIINHCLDAFGPDRVVFAGDWPVCLRGMPLRDWVGLLKAVVAHRPEQDQRKLFHDNAVKFYALPAWAAPVLRKGKMPVLRQPFSGPELAQIASTWSLIRSPRHIRMKWRWTLRPFFSAISTAGALSCGMSRNTGWPLQRLNASLSRVGPA